MSKIKKTIEIFNNKIQKAKLQPKKLILIVGIGIIFLIIIYFIFQPQSTNQVINENTASLSPTATDIQNAAQHIQNNNPLINNNVANQIENAFRKKIEKQSGKPLPPKPQYQFHYELAPNLKDKTSYFPVPVALAAGSCDLSGQPATVPVYILKTNINPNEAADVANTYNLNFPPSSVPTDDGISYKYYFADPPITSYLTVTAPSGMTYFHEALPDDPKLPDITFPQATSKASNVLSAHNLTDKMVLKNSQFDGKEGKFVFLYQKNYGNFPMVDSPAIAAIDMATPVCNIQPSTTTNFVEIMLTTKGNVWKLLNQTRQTTKTVTYKRLSLQKVLEEYKDSPPIAPIVIGKGTSGNVTIDEATIVWYEYGESFPQVSYIPMYLTSGKTSDGLTRVLTLYPTVSLQDLSTLEMPSLSEAHSNLQLYTFYPPPANNPPPPMIPNTSIIPSGQNGSISGSPISIPSGFSMPGGLSSISSGTGGLGAGGSFLGCMGGKVDYIVHCNDASGAMVCQGMSSVPDDPFGVCKNGTQTKNQNITVGAQQNPCSEVFKQNKISETNTVGSSFTGTVPGLVTPTSNFKGGTVTCTIQGSPC